MTQDEFLIYIIKDTQDERQLVLYDPISNQHTQLLPDWEIGWFDLSPDNRLAFSSPAYGNNEIYILDYPFADNIPIKITSESSTHYSSIDWSPDGHHLLLESTDALIVWDENRIVPIFKYHVSVGEITWSQNGQLAFTAFYTHSYPFDGDPSEVFIWDGKTTVSVSQNPTGDDRYPAWSKDNQLAFISDQNGEYDIFVWDGRSKANGSPDKDTYQNIAPELTFYLSSPTWTNANSIAFVGTSDQGPFVQIYEWDGNSVNNISQNPLFHNGGETWRNDGYWAFVTFFSSGQFLYIRDNKNQTVLETKGQYQPVWSRNGLLIFCVPERPNWTLSLWNGINVIAVVHGYSIAARWNNGEFVHCSNG